MQLFIGGGVDSSIITAVASNYLQRQGKQFNTFSFDFTGNDTYFKANAFQPERDRVFIEKMLECYPLNHTFLECDNTTQFELLPTVTKAHDLPCMADVDSSLLHFCKAVKSQSKVALTGECADEYFGGYPWHHRAELLNAPTFPWSRDLLTRTMLFREDFVKRLQLDEYTDTAYKKTINATPLLDGENPLDKRRREVTYLNIKWFMATLLERMDRCSMQSGLEARVPFANFKLLEYVFNVPYEFKTHNGIVKGLLREAFVDLLPPELLQRKKSPYPKTYNPHYTELLAQELTRIISDKRQPICEFLDLTKTAEFINSPFSYDRPWYGQLMATPQLMAYLLQMNTWLRG